MLKCRGFTLVETLVVIFIIIILSGIIFANYRQGDQQFALQRSANKLAQDIRRAQQMAMSAQEHSSCSGNPNYKFGSGVYLTTSDSLHYLLFADCDNNQDYDSGVDGIIEEIKDFEIGVKINNLSGDPLRITFTPPNPTVNIKPAAPASIQLGNDIQTKTIAVNTAGLIEIQ